MRDSVIVSAVRTPIGKFLGGLKDLKAPQLGALVVREAVRRAGIDPEQSTSASSATWSAPGWARTRRARRRSAAASTTAWPRSRSTRSAARASRP